MELLVSFVLLTAAALLAVPVSVFFSEIVAAVVCPRQRFCPSVGTRGRVTVLVPAHNESAGLLPTLADILHQLRPKDRLLVVADNCNDDTAVQAAIGGAEVIERYDSTKRGKGYALDFGLRHLSSDPPEIVIVIDADCRLGDHTIENLATTCAMIGRPVQALDLMVAPSGANINHYVAEFAWRVKNWLRPIGLAALGFPCQLAGTGMAIPWDLMRSADLAHGDLVEDLKLGLELALSGHPPIFCPAACVTSQFPLSVISAESQRSRWEQGHVNTIVKLAPRLVARAIAERNVILLALTLDLAVPPLSMLGMLVVGTFLIAALAAIFDFDCGGLFVSTVSLIAFVSAAFLAWFKSGRDILGAGAILPIARHAFAKIPLYCRLVSDTRRAEWIRTDRS
jgi:cellulose synthase/poly-beta-1,6-N-acetylglucosamine synthase-like glycosyltransferase